MDESEHLLAVATPEEWDCFMTFCADYHGHYIKPSISKRFLEMAEIYHEVFGKGVSERVDEIVDVAIARLDAAGIWEGEDETS